MESYSVESCVRGKHIYKVTWEAGISEDLSCQCENGNSADLFAVAFLKNDMTVRHIPQMISYTTMYKYKQQSMNRLDNYRVTDACTSSTNSISMFVVCTVQLKSIHKTVQNSSSKKAIHCRGGDITQVVMELHQLASTNWFHYAQSGVNVLAMGATLVQPCSDLAGNHS